MGFVRMRKNFGHHMRTLMWVIIAFFLVSCFYFFGAYVGGPRRASQSQPAGEVLATVNGEKIRRGEYELAFVTRYEQWERMGVALLGALELMRWRLLNELVERRLLVAAAKREGIKVSGRELKQEMARQVEQRLQQQGSSDPEHRRLIENWVDARADEIREQMLVQRLHQEAMSGIKVSDDDVRESYRQIRARHILVAVDESGQRGLPDEQAKQKAEQILAKLKAGADFATLARRESDDKASAARGGDLGLIARGQMAPEFEQAAFALQVGQLSDVVRTQDGYDIILVEERPYRLPDDFEKKKKQYHQQYLQQRQAQVWQGIIERLREQAKIKVRDPEMRAIQAMTEGKTDEAITQFTKALKSVRRLGDQVHAAVYFSLGALYSTKGDWKAAADSYEKSLDLAMSSLDEIYIALGRTYTKLGNKAKALEYYKAAEDEAPDNYLVRQQLLAAYRELGEQEAAARQQTWIDEEQRKRMEEMARAQAEESKRGETARSQAGSEHR